MSTSEDARVPELLQRVRDGDSQAGQELFSRYSKRLIALASQQLSQKLASRVDAEEVVQSAFRSFFRRDVRGDFKIDAGDHLWRLLVKLTLDKARAKARYHSAGMRDVGAEIAEGDAALAEDGFETALDKYEEAYDLDRDRADIQAKIDVANEKLLAYLENQSNKDAYDAAIAEGNNLFEQANWAMAKSSFEEALEIYANETYPKSKIEEIDVQLALLLQQQEAERQAGLMVEFNQFIEAGDKRFNRKKYDKALEEYEAALSLIPNNQIAKEKIASVNDILMKNAEDTANQNAYAIVQQKQQYNQLYIFFSNPDLHFEYQ